MKLPKIILYFFLLTSYAFTTLKSNTDPQMLEDYIQILSELEEQAAKRDKKDCTQDKLCTVISKLNALKNQFNCHDARVRSDFAQLFSEVDRIISKEDDLSEEIAQCCEELKSKIDSLTLVPDCDFSGTYTLLNSVLSKEDVIIDNLETLIVDQNACCTTLNAKINNLTNIVNIGFDDSFMQLNMVIAQNNSVSSKIDLCCATLNSKIDSININNQCDLSGTFTAFDACCFTLGSKIDAININSSCDLAGTFTVLDQVLTQEISTQSKLDLCCNTIVSQLDTLAGLVAADFAGTFTSLDACCLTLNSKIDAININSTCDLSGAFTALNACCSTLNSKIDILLTSTCFGSGSSNPCTLTPISGPTVLSAAGSYCLISGFAVASGDGILITGNNITLDLNSKTVVGTGGNNGIHIASSASNVSIINGSIVGMNNSGILIEGNKCLVQNCAMNDNLIGLNIINAQANRIIGNTAITNLSAGFALTNARNTLVLNNRAIANGSDNNAYGFISSAGFGNIFEQCIADNTITTTNAQGFIAAGFILTGTECCSKILDCKADNTQTASFGFAVPYGIYLEEDFVGTVTLKTSNFNGTSITAVNWSPDGRYLAVGDRENDLRVYSFNGRSLLFTASALSGLQNSVDWSPDGTYLAAGGPTALDGFEIHVFAFNGNSLTPIATANSSNGVPVTSVEWSPDGNYLAVGILNAGGESMMPSVFQIAVFFFDGNSLTLVDAITYFDGSASISTIDWSPNEQFLAVGSGRSMTIPGLVSIYSFDQTTALLSLVTTQTPGPVIEIEWSPNGKFLGVAQIDNGDGVTGRIYHFDGSVLDQVASATAGDTEDKGPQPGFFNSIDWTPDGEFIAFGGSKSIMDNATIRIYSFDNSTITGTTQIITTDPVSQGALEWTQSEKYLASGSRMLSSGANLPAVHVFKSFTRNTCKNVVKNNTVSCVTGGCGTGVGINADTTLNTVLGNTSSNNDRNYLFVENIYTGGLYNSPTPPTNIQNISLSSR